MARLIPSFMDDCTPPGERDVFNMLAAGPDQWIALHSVDLAPWNRGLRTEIDFVVIVPDTGILCIEVKSQESIAFENDRWFPPTIKRSPFKQAADGSSTLYRRLRELVPHARNVPVVHCCIFPRARFDLSTNLTVNPWELMDCRTFRALQDGNSFCADLRGRMQTNIKADGNLKPLTNRLSQAQIEDIINACLPVRKRTPGAREEIERRQENVDAILREQQTPVLKLATLNRRLVVTGGAGTGKTLIAMEVARRAAERGNRVALLCFNQLVGEWLKAEVMKLSPPLPTLIAGRAIRVLAEMTDVQIPDKPSPQFWELELPALIEECLTDPEFKAVASFDYLIVDEAQDILARPRLWECLLQLLAGGLEKGSFSLFGDFDNQVLTQRRLMYQTLTELDNSARPTRWGLTENCRNYRIVGESAVRLGGVGDIYSGYLRGSGGVHNYNILFYEDEQAQLDRLQSCLREFRSEGYKPSEITILSLCHPESSAAERLKSEGVKLRPAWQAGNYSTYTSIHSFKGMENKIVILTDLSFGDSDSRRHLLYIGLTRATESVRILCDWTSRQTLLAWLTGSA
jgi:hypothetical protein